MPKNSGSDDSQEKTGKKGKSKKKTILLIILIVLVVLAGSAGAYFFFHKPAGDATQAKKAPPKAVDLQSLDMGDMVVNLAGDGEGHFLRVKVVLEYPTDSKLSAELKQKTNMISDVLITALRSKTLSDVSSPGSTQGLKNDLLKAVNSHLDTGAVTEIYFTDFLVQ